ncbi:MAG: S-methyl-5'-thioadenosine phosphorylase [Halobacteriota archaeon]|nr:S-methyl-5'-thioadenosine phosphorylase [Halobacteriota archaeon]
MEKRAEIGIIGGSGVYNPAMLSEVESIEVDTPFGKPSSAITVGMMGDRRVAFLPRHGVGHHISPSELNSKANIYALKKLGVSFVISAAAVGSLKEEIKPLDIVIPDQIFDRTRRRGTFFEDGIVAHISFADPFCKEISELLYNAAKKKGYAVHDGGTYVCIEGPQFSTRAESHTYRQLGFDIIGMTAIPEAKLAREAEICYATMATVTDYDVWKDEEVDIEMVISNVQKNELTVRDVIADVIPKIEISGSCKCQNALESAIVTDRNVISEKAKVRLKLLIGRYL